MFWLFYYANLYGAWDIANFLKNLLKKVQDWGGLLVMAMGAAGVVWGFIQAIIGLISHGKKPTNWLVIIALIVVGGALMVGGWNLMNSIAEGGRTTINELGGGFLLWGR